MAIRTDDPSLDLRRTDTAGKSETYWRWRAHFEREFAAARAETDRKDAHAAAVDSERDQAREDHLLSLAYRGRKPSQAPDLEKAMAAFSEASRNAWKR